MIEEEIFKKYKIDKSKLISYGFNKKQDKYLYSTNILDNTFRVDIEIGENILGKIIDLDTNEEYTNYRLDNVGGFSNQVRDEYEKVLIDIRNNCYTKEYFIYSQSNRITNMIIDKYHNEPEFLWDDDTIGVFRKKVNKKWYGIIMNIDKKKLDEEECDIEILNVKLDEELIGELLKRKGFYKAYHMNKKYWITITLDDTINDDEIMKYIEISYDKVKEK